ncbi:disintegrin and metalloproteinase domain-containing protein 21-like [Dama dama]
MLAEGRVTLRAALWLLGLWAVLAAVQCSPDRPSWRYISTEVVIPRKEPHQGKGAQVLGWLSYSLRFGGQRHVIRMRRKRLFWPGYLMMTQDDQGVLQTDHPFVPEDCYYFGYLEETPFSMVTMNTCYGGLQGYMKLDDLTYEISPLKHSQKFEHAVSQMVVDTNVMGPMHRPGYEEERDPLLSPANITAVPRLSSKLFFFHVAHIKGVVQSTNAFYRTVNNVSTAAQYMVEVGNIIDAVYRGLEIRSIGLYYDGDNCVCQRRTTCIMNVYQSLTDAFSNCSYMHLTRVLSSDTSDCMFDPRLVYYNKSMTHERCGNGEVESGERCDCGSFKECYNNPCCDSLCSWTARSNCDAEACCTNCTFSKPGMLCRPIQSICDLPEYCRGVSKTCPKDVFMQDGTPCGEEGYCFNGSCTDRNVHCKEIFGRGAFNAPNSCYILNRSSNRFGHCRRNPTSRGYIPCRKEDQLCGRLQCTNVTSLPRLQEHVAFHQTHISGFLCFGLDLHRGTGTVDVGRVREGTLCGDGMYCLNTFCNSSVSKIEYTCLPQKCSFRGVCNSEDHCHCHVGWAPPLCKTMGKGGSADSGPPPNLFRSVPYDETIFVYLRLVFARLYALTAALLFGVATNVKTIQTSKIKEETVKPV